jgi:predicted ribosome quality control (RQC) complex YloA/Tae2 family protein
MPLDGITAKCLAAELDAALSGARIDKIYQPDRFDVVLMLRKDSTNLRLLLSANPSAPRIHFITSSADNPPEAPSFCMLLRKHLSGGRVIDVTTPFWERVFVIRIQTVDELGDHVERSLIAELMGKQSNLVLVGAHDRILDCILHVDHSVSRVREVMPGRFYEPVPTQGKPDAAAVLASLERGGDPFAGCLPSLPLEKALLASIQGFSPPLCRDVCRRASQDPSARLDSLEGEALERILGTLRSTLERILSGHFEPSVFFRFEEDPVPYDFHCLPLSDSGIIRRVRSVTEGMESHYAGRALRNVFDQSRGDLLKTVDTRLEKMVKKLSIHESDRAACADRDRWKRFGDLILASFTEIPEGASMASLRDFYQEDAPRVDVPLDSTLSPSRNAQRYFKKFTKERLKEEASLRLAEEDRLEIAYLETLRQGVLHAVDLMDLQALRLETAQLDGKAAPTKPVPRGKPRKEPKALPPRHFISTDGFDILVGRSNLQNDQLTLKKASSSDLWFHVQKAPGTHVIVRREGRDVPDATMLEAASIAAWFSRATLADRRSDTTEGAKTAVDFCPVRNVRKPPGAKPGMVVYDTYKTLFVTPRAPKETAGARI